MFIFCSSLFVLLEGRSKEQAFKIGYEMADAVTATNPAPIKLKFEKVCSSLLMLSGKMAITGCMKREESVLLYVRSLIWQKVHHFRNKY